MSRGTFQDERRPESRCGIIGNPRSKLGGQPGESCEQVWTGARVCIQARETEGMRITLEAQKLKTPSASLGASYVSLWTMSQARDRTAIQSHSRKQLQGLLGWQLSIAIKVWIKGNTGDLTQPEFRVGPSLPFIDPILLLTQPLLVLAN